jgi:hypothetical protein
MIKNRAISGFKFYKIDVDPKDVDPGAPGENN